MSRRGPRRSLATMCARPPCSLRWPRPTPNNVDLSRRALSEAIGAGDMALALRLARSIPPAKLPSDARLLLVADELRRNRTDRALAWLSAAGRQRQPGFPRAAGQRLGRGRPPRPQRRARGARQDPGEQPAGSVARRRAGADPAQVPPHRRKPSHSRGARSRPRGGRENRLRLAFADGFLAAGDQASAR